MTLGRPIARYSEGTQASGWRAGRGSPGAGTGGGSTLSDSAGAGRLRSAAFIAFAIRGGRRPSAPRRRRRSCAAGWTSGAPGEDGGRRRQDGAVLAVDLERPVVQRALGD